MTSTTQAAALDSASATLAPARPRPRPASYGRNWSFALVIIDVAMAGGAVCLASALAHQPLALLAVRQSALQSVLFGIVLWFMLFERIGMYRRSFSSNARDEVYATMAGSAMAVAPTLAIFLLVPALVPFRHLLVGAILLAVAGAGVTRYVAHVLRANVFPMSGRRIAVVGSPERVAAVPGDLSLTAADKVLRLGIEDFDAEIAAASGELDRLDWLRVAVANRCDELIVTEALPPELMPALLRLTEARGMKLAFAPMRIRPHACDFTVRRDGGLALLYPQSLAICTPGAELLRRTIDVAIAVPALVLASPLMALIAAAVMVDSGRPILYRQRRVGKHGHEFEILKFRTMTLDAEAASGPIWARGGERRVTRVGRFLRRTSLDELPQLFNVVRGEMSIVGPRPERPFYVEQFRKMLPRYDERHLVRPGVTGWSHVHMRRNVDTSAIGERLSYDLFYLEHWSVFMDVLIVCKTAFEFLFHSAV